jgi:hypothetical protein
VVLILVATSSAFAYSMLTYRPLANNSPSTSHFIGQPVVDVIIQNLTRQGQGVPEPLNVTRGSSTKLLIEVFPTVDLAVYFRMNIFSMKTGENKTSSFIITFDPTSVSVRANSEATAFMTISVPFDAPTGTFDAIASAINQKNPTQVWGLVFTMSVS